jgi:hypothetical protein
MENQDVKTTSRQQELIERIIELQGKLEDAKLGIGNNQNVKNHYNGAYTKVVAARARIAAAYNEKYRSSSAYVSLEAATALLEEAVVQSIHNAGFNTILTAKDCRTQNYYYIRKNQN